MTDLTADRFITDITPRVKLSSVSAIVPTGTTSPTILESYTYDGGDLSMESISKLSPTGSGTSTTTFTLDPHGDEITGTTDGEGNQCLYAYTTDGAHTLVTVENSVGTVIQSFKVGFSANGSVTSVTDGTGSTVIYTATYADPNDPYRPSEVQDGDSRAWYYTYDT